MKKKFMRIILALTICVSLCSHVFAAEVSDKPIWTITVNEYDAYVKMRQDISDGIPTYMDTDTINEIQSDKIENCFMELSNLSTEELYSRGYDEKQISILRNYNGQRIEDCPELRSVAADMTCTFYVETASTTDMRIRIEWNWSSVPATGGNLKDQLAVAWDGGNYVDLKMGSLTRSTVTYENMYTGEQSVYTCDLTPTSFYGIIASFPQNLNYNQSYYPKSGKFILDLDVTRGTINNVGFLFVYGHETLVVSPGISIDGNLSISVGIGMTEMYRQLIYINKDGIVV